MMRFHDMVTDEAGTFLYQKLGHSIKDEVCATVREQARTLPIHGFAWPERRLFPITTKEAAAASSVYAQAQDGIPDAVHTRIKEALDLHGVEASTIEKIASAPPDPDEFLIPEKRLMRVSSADEVKTAELLLHEHAPNMETVTRTYAFRRLHEKALQFNVKLASESARMIAATRCHVPTLISQLYKRAHQTKVAAVKEAYTHMAHGLSGRRQMYIDNPAEQDKIAQLIHDLDTKAKNTYRYGRPNDLGFDDPILAVFNTEKTAADYVTLAGQEIPIENIMALDPDMISDVVGDEFLEDIQDDSGDVDPAELAQVLSIMPEDMQEQIVSRLELA